MLQLVDLDPKEREERQRAIQKLLARAEYSKVCNPTLYLGRILCIEMGRDGVDIGVPDASIGFESCRRAPRTSVSLLLHSLLHCQSRIHSDTSTAQLTRGLRARLAYASYKAANNLSHVPLPVLEDRIHEPSPSLSPAPQPPSSPYSATQKRRAAMAPPSSPSRSLYSSLLGPPPSKRPRHVYGVASASGSGPTPADFLSAYTPTTPRKPPPSPHRSTHVHSPFVNGGQGRTVRTVLQGRARSTVTEKEDMNAAATLTALMFNRASPRQRSEDGGPRTTTPVPLSGHKATEDADAAELMLYLATSPSPVRPPVTRRAPGSMGRVLFPGAGAVKPDVESFTDGDMTPALTAGHASSGPSSQETNAMSQLLPPPPSPSLSLSRSQPVGSPSTKKTGSFDVSRRLFADSDESHRIVELREGGARFGLGKGIDLVEAK